MLGATIKHHQKPKDNQPDHHPSEDFYIDNLIIGADNMEEALQLYSKVKLVFLDISMNLRAWNSSSPELNRKIAEQDCMKETITKIAEQDCMKETITKLLGLQRDKITDQLMVDTKKFDNSMTATTKRQVLTTIASLFDPLGYLTPTTLKMKSKTCGSRKKDATIS